MWPFNADVKRDFYSPCTAAASHQHQPLNRALDSLSVPIYLVCRF
ncbi:uncharacterized protein PgNI_01043 [Pyricularia grisea]|uniref:Uncharacterized protein n=1 Tax=Pyricularia grisea TaxID=148305 RepID=A0A6P8BGP6_PYRGI|nr:uncharacterized protein PgNI_01043 [Pyricularia grisea]TLD15958.1 hypothetical protein PgNI_01043 [Pyricularia grisea]